MKIQILRTEPEDPVKTGIGTYAERVADVISKNGIEFEEIPFEVSIADGWKGLLRSGVINPLTRILKGRRDTDIVHSVFEYCSLYFPFSKAKRIVTFHHVVEANEKNSRKWYITWRFFAWISVVFSDKIISVSSQTKEELLKKYSIPESKIEVVTHTSEGFMVLGDTPKDRMVGCMGTINERKNFAAAVRVFGGIVKDLDLSDYRMVICGKGPLKGALMEQIRSLRLEDRVSFIQDVSKDELVSFYNRCSLVLNTSSHEGLGLATIEAQMCGTPVVYFADACIPAEVMAAAVPCRDEKDMTEAAVEILKNGDRSAELVSEGLRFTAKLGTDFEKKMIDIYRNVLN